MAILTVCQNTFQSIADGTSVASNIITTVAQEVLKDGEI